MKVKKNHFFKKVNNNDNNYNQGEKERKKMQNVTRAKHEPQATR